MGDSCGILYLAVGETSYIDELMVSANSARRAMPNVSMTLATDLDIKHHPFNSIKRLERLSDGYRTKIQIMLDPPYDRTIYLDADTYVARDLTEMFKVLDQFDVAATHEPYRVTDATVELPDAFPQFNTGVIAFRREAMRKLAVRWLDLYDNLGFAARLGFDQDPFRIALYESDFRIATLPPEFNTRFPATAGYYNLPVAIFHSHATEAEFEQAATLMTAERREYWHGHVYIDRQVWGPLRSARKELDMRPPELIAAWDDYEGLALLRADRIAELEQTLKLRDDELSRHKAWLESIQLSASWRLTVPLRVAKRKARQLLAVGRRRIHNARTG